MKNKKLMSLFLALAMVFAMAVPTFAGQLAANERSTTLAGGAKGYTLKLTVGNSGNIVVNPYKISFTPTVKDQGFALEEATTDQIINPGTFITNETDIPLQVDVTVTPTATGITLLDTHAKINNKAAAVRLGTLSGDPETWTQAASDTNYNAKAAFLTFEIMKTTDAESEPTTWKTPKEITTQVGTNTDKINTNTDKTQSVAILDAARTITECLNLAAVGEEDEPNYACFHVSGYLNVYPQKPNKTSQPTELVADDWTENDKISATVLLTFKPNVDASPIT